MTGSADVPAVVARKRLANQRLTGAAFRSPTEVVARMGAIQAQDYAGAKWAIAMRTAGATDADVERAIISGSILRTHVLRPTWHFVAAADIRWMLALTGPRVSRIMSYYNKRLGLTPALFRRSHDVIARALESGKQLTRTEVAAALKRARIDVSKERLGRLLMQAELDAVICSGARRARQFTYALLDERAPATEPLQRDEALAQLATRYFTTRSPATAQDFAWWSGLTVTDARRGAEMVRRPTQRPVAAESTVHLLPNYDEYFIAYRDRSAILSLVSDVKPMQRNSALFAHVIEIGGQLVGGWRRAPAGKSVIVRTTYLVPPTAAQRRAVAAQAKRYGEFLGIPVEID